MTVNMGMTDRVIRFIVGAFLIVAPLIDLMGLGASTWLAVVLFAVGAILVLTAAVGMCPLYRVLGIKTSHS